MVVPFCVSAGRRWWGVAAERELGNRGDEFARVGMPGSLEDLIGRALFDDDAVFHDEDAVAQVTDDAEVVRDEEVGDPSRFAQRDQQVEDLRLDRHVERRHRLVEHDDRGARGEGAGDRDALTLAARHPQRETTCDLDRQADQVEQFATRARRAARGRELARGKSVEQDALHVPARIERTQRVLVDDRDETSTPAPLRLGQGRPLVAEQLARCRRRGLRGRARGGPSCSCPSPTRRRCRASHRRTGRTRRRRQRGSTGRRGRCSAS